MEDVIIVGGGISGLACGLRLAEEGISPLVLEKERELGHKACGEMVVDHVGTFSIFEFLPKRCIERKFERIIFKFYDREYVRELFTPLFTINRKKFETILYRKCKRKGVVIKVGRKVEKIERKKNFLCIDNEFNTRIVVGADGFNSIVRKFIGEKIKEFGFALSLKLSCKRKLPEIVINKHIIPQGYVWKFPLKKEINFGIGSVSSKINIILHWKRYTRINKKPKIAPIPTSLPCKTYANNVLLIGDAASLIDSFSGAGINISLITATFAAEVIRKAIERKTYRESFLKKYEVLWRKEIGRLLVRQYIKKKLFWKYFMNFNKLPLRIFNNFWEI